MFISKSSSLCKARGPRSRSLVVLFPVRLVDAGDLGDQRVVRVAICEQRADGQQDLGDGERRRPLATENVQTDGTVGVDVGMVDLGGEGNLGGLEGVVRGEVDGEVEHAPGVGRVLGPDDGGLPVEDVLAHGAGGAVGGRVLVQVKQLLCDSFHSHVYRCCKT